MIKILTILPIKSRYKFIFLLGLMIISAFAEMLSLGAVVPFLTLMVSPETIFNLPIIGPLLAQQDRRQLTLIVGGLFLLALMIATLLRILLLHSNSKFAHQAGYELSVRAFGTILAQPYLWHVQHNSSDQIGQLNRVNDFIKDNVQPFLVIVTSSILGLGILTVLFISEPIIMSFMVSIIAFFYIFTVLTVRRQLFANGLLMNRAWVTKVRILQESLGGIRDVILDNSQAVQKSAFELVERYERSARIKNEWIAQLPRYLVEFFGIVTIVSLAILFSDSRQASIATLGLLALGSQRLLPLAQQIYLSLNTLRIAEASRGDVSNLLLLSDSLIDKPEIALPFRQKILFNSVYFHYPSSSGWVLNNLNFSLNKGERIGIVGPSGGGKSTLIDLIMGLLQPTQGQLIIDDQPLTTDSLPAWRMRIAHVPQSIFLLDATLRENIALGVASDAIDELRLARAIAQSQLTQVVSNLPNREYTPIGERGILLSGGQRQRIGIARALYRQADVLVMDEATSALDNHTESEVISAISGLGSDITVVMIAHRISTLEFCDRILNIEAGELVCVKSYSDYISKNKDFRQ